MKFKLRHLLFFVFLIALGLWRYTQQSVLTADFHVVSFDLLETDDGLYGNCDIEIAVPGQRLVKHHIAVQGAPSDWIKSRKSDETKGWVRFRSQDVWPLSKQSPQALIYRNFFADSIIVADPNLDVPLDAGNQIMVIVEMLE